jgi:hypothetical protein
MAKRELKARAIQMRMQEMSYSQIRAELGVSKGTLSGWLQDYPLSESRISELRGWSERRIERCRETKALKKENRLKSVYERVTNEIGRLSEREFFIAGLFLYWGEGSKTQNAMTAISNTDPAVLVFFIKWIQLLGAPKENLRVYVHLYADMNVEAEMRYWSDVLNLPRAAFRKPYIKKSNQIGLTYPQRFTHGTCNLLYGSRDTCEYVRAALKRIRHLVCVDSASMIP